MSRGSVCNLDHERAMRKVVAILSVSLGGHGADRHDGVPEPSAEHLRRLWSELGAGLTGAIAGVGATHLRHPVRRA